MLWKKHGSEDKVYLDPTAAVHPMLLKHAPVVDAFRVAADDVRTPVGPERQVAVADLFFRQHDADVGLRGAVLPQRPRPPRIVEHRVHALQQAVDEETVVAHGRRPARQQPRLPRRVPQVPVPRRRSHRQEHRQFFLLRHIHLLQVLVGAAHVALDTEHWE